jgi:predicted transcriptional regulator
MISESVGLSTSIVSMLKEYKTALPIDFLAEQNGRRVSEVMERLKPLVKQGVVTITGNSVSLVSREPIRR